jgi:hypothetical protein
MRCLIRPVFAALVALAAVVGVAVAQPTKGFSPTTAPVSPDGIRATVDLPVSQHMKNTGGSDGPRGPGSGSGLCVFTSLQHSAYWQNIRTLDGFREWMTHKPGGGYPQKVDKMLAQFCREKGVTLPPYVQHTGGDAAFLELALKTGRMPAVTYCGRDDFYPFTIAHMVSLAYLDDKQAAIIDNNRPGYWLWMSRGDFLARWRGNSGGWGVVFLAESPPPHLPQASARRCGCCKLSCNCSPGKRDKDCECYPCQCNEPAQVFGQCSGGCCPLRPAPLSVSPAVPSCPNCPDGVCPLPATSPGGDASGRSGGVYVGPVAPCSSPIPGYEWGLLSDGVSYGWVKSDAAAKVAPAQPLTGVESDKVHAGPSYSINGREVTRDQAHTALGGSLVDDSDHWHLTAVGDPDFIARFKADVAKLPAATRSKLLVQTYAPDHWAVSLFDLPQGVSLRKPSTNRVAAEVSRKSATDYAGPGSLDAILSAEGGPEWKPSPPAPAPTPKQPDQPKSPDGKNASPSNTPASEVRTDRIGWLVAAFLGLSLVLNRK